MAQDNVIYDVAGYEQVTNAIVELINQFPDLSDEISFASLGEESGKVIYPISGGQVQREINSITGHTYQECKYPFYVIYRAGGVTEKRRIAICEWLNKLGEWLEKQPVTISGIEYQLEKYPPLTGTREFKNIKRDSTAHPYSESDDGTEEWAILMQALYVNEFDR